MKLVTERLIIRDFKFSDDKDLYEMCKDPLTAYNAGWTPHPNINATRNVVLNYSCGDETFAIILKEENAFIGDCGITLQNINGKEVLNRNSYKLEKLQEVPETISVDLNKKILNKEINELTILVQNLGFDKGFSGDTNNPRGLVICETTPAIPLEFSVCEKLSIERRDWRESENPYLAKITAHFDIDFKDNEFFAKYISLEDFKCRRATIFLNGVKIGRYIKRTHVQDKFYLINEFLKPHNTLEIVVWAKERNTKSLWGFKFDLKNVKIKLGTFKKYQLFK